MKHILYITLALLLLSSCKQVVRLNDEQQKADAVYLEMKKEHILNEDGTSVYKYSHKLKLQSYRAMNRSYGESFIVYNPKHQKLKITKSITYQESGDTIHSTSNAYNEVLPRWAENSLAHNHLTEMVVSHIGLEVGCVIEFAYELENDASFGSNLMVFEDLSKQAPIKELDIIVSIPKDKDLNMLARNVDNDFQYTKHLNQKHYLWKFENLSALDTENSMANVWEHNKALAFSTQSWNNFFQFLNEKNTLSLSEEEANLFLAKEEKDTLKAIQQSLNKLSKKLNSLHVRPEYMSYQLRDYKEICKAGAATDIEYEFLTAAVLNQIPGVKAELIWSLDKQLYQSNLALPELLKGVYVKLSVENKGAFLVNHNQLEPLYTQWGLKEKSWLTNSGDLWEPADKFQKDAQYQKAEIKLYTNGVVQGIGEWNLAGVHNPNLEIMLSGQNKLDYAKSKLEEGSRLMKLRIDTDSLTSKYYINHKANLENKAGMYVFNLPELPVSARFLAKNYYNQGERKFDFTIDYPVDYDQQLELSFFDKWKVQNTDTLVQIQNELGKLEFQIQQIEAGKLRLKRKLQINKTHIEASEYKELVKLLNTWNDKKYWRLFFQRV